MIGRRKLLPPLAFALLAPGRASAEQMMIRLGTTSSAGAFAQYTAALTDVMRTVDPLLELRIVPTKGSVDNAERLKSGEIDIGLVGGEVTYEALASQIPGAPGVGVISVMNSTPGMFAVRADSRFRRIVELKGRPIAWGAKGLGITVQARYIMDGIGLSMDRDFVPVYQEKFSEGPAMVLDGRVAALWGSGYRWPGFVTLSTSPVGMRFVVPDQREIQRICAKYSFMARFTVPAGLYVGQYDPVETVGTWNFILGRPELDESMGYRFISSLHRAEKLGLLSKYLAQTTVKNTMTAVANPNHFSPGVLQYYRKAGLVKS
jgi:uncharacterized protein